jgi:hypothetical protein
VIRKAKINATGPKTVIATFMTQSIRERDYAAIVLPAPAEQAPCAKAGGEERTQGFVMDRKEGLEV